MRPSESPSRAPSAPRSVSMVVGIVALGAAAVIGWLLAKEADRLSERGPADAALMVVPVVDGLIEESRELEMMFDDAVIEGAVPTGEQLMWLEEAVAAQREFVRLVPVDSGPEFERLASLEVKLATARVHAYSGPIDAHERAADELLSAGDAAGAIEALRSAVRELDLAIERGAPLSDRKTQVLARMENILAASLGAKVDRLENEARQARNEGRNADADGLLAEAIVEQRRINFEFSRASSASFERQQALERLRAEWAP